MTKVRQYIDPPPRCDDWFAFARHQIRHELIAQKVRQCDLALVMAVSEKHISQVLNGLVKNPQMLAAIANELGLVFVLAKKDEDSTEGNTEHQPEET